MPMSNARASLSFAMLAALLSSSASTAHATTYYVRAGATGTDDGSTWADAFTDLPSSLVRGATYYVAAGDYGVCDFKDPESGSTVITVKKATPGDHGTDMGWSASYASGVAHFQNFVFETGYYVIDGQTGGGPGSWTSGFGFETYPDLAWTYPIMIRGPNWGVPPLPTHITLRHIEVRGAGYHAAAAPDGLGTSVSAPTGPGCGPDDLTVEYCYVHDTALGQVSLHLAWANNATIRYNEFARNYCTSAQHSEALVILSDNQVTIAYNRFVDIEGSAIIAIGAVTPGTTVNNDIDVYGNEFYWTSSYAPTAFGLGMGFFGHDVGDGQPSYVITNARVYNNTVVGITSNPKVYNSGVYIPNGTGNQAYNNLFVNCTRAAMVIAGTEDYNTAINSTTYLWAGAHDVQLLSGDPFADLSHADFSLTGPTVPGISLPAPFNVDMLGHTTRADGSWDRGALQYRAASASPLGASSANHSGGDVVAGCACNAGRSAGSAEGLGLLLAFAGLFARHCRRRR